MEPAVAFVVEIMRSLIPEPLATGGARTVAMPIAPGRFCAVVGEWTKGGVNRESKSVCALGGSSLVSALLKRTARISLSPAAAPPPPTPPTPTPAPLPSGRCGDVSTDMLLGRSRVLVLPE